MSVELDPKTIKIQDGSGWRRLPMIGGALAVVGFGVALAVMPDDMVGLRKWWSSYLVGFMAVLALGFGGAFFTIVQHVVRASWSVTVRRIAENMALTLPVTGLFGALLVIAPGHHPTEHPVEHVEKAPAGAGDLCEYANADEPTPGTETIGCKAGLICDPWVFECAVPPRGLDATCSEKESCAGGLVCEEGKCAEPHVSKFPGSQHVFEWTHTAVVQNDEMLRAKAPYLNVKAANIRYWAWFMPAWIFMGFGFWRWSIKQDTSSEPEKLAVRERWWAPIALLLFGMTISFSAFDFLMSLDPHWFSTMFGVYFFVGCTLTVMSFMVIITHFLRRSGYLEGVVTNEHFHDLGKFMFGFTVFWAYIAFSQYFLIWYANIPEETHWFAYRGHGDWLTLSIFLVAGRFVVPFFILLRRPLKRNPNQLVLIAFWFLFMEIVEIFWLVQPAYQHHLANHYRAIGDWASYHWYSTQIDFALSDGALLVGFIGVFLGVFGWALNRHFLVPVKDPRLAESISHENF